MTTSQFNKKFRLRNNNKMPHHLIISVEKIEIPKYLFESNYWSKKEKKNGDISFMVKFIFVRISVQLVKVAFYAFK